MYSGNFATRASGAFAVSTRLHDLNGFAARSEEPAYVQPVGFGCQTASSLRTDTSSAAPLDFVPPRMEDISRNLTSPPTVPVPPGLSKAWPVGSASDTSSTASGSGLEDAYPAADSYVPVIRPQQIRQGGLGLFDGYDAGVAQERAKMVRQPFQNPGRDGPKLLRGRDGSSAQVAAPRCPGGRDGLGSSLCGQGGPNPQVDPEVMQHIVEYLRRTGVSASQVTALLQQQAPLQVDESEPAESPASLPDDRKTRSRQRPGKARRYRCKRALERANTFAEIEALGEATPTSQGGLYMRQLIKGRFGVPKGLNDICDGDSSSILGQPGTSSQNPEGYYGTAAPAAGLVRFVGEREPSL